MIKYRVEYLREKRMRGELPPARHFAVTQRIREWGYDLDTNFQSILGLLLLLLMGVLALPFLPLILGKELYDKQYRRRQLLKSWEKSLLGVNFPKSLENLADLKPKYLQKMCGAFFWKNNKGEVRQLLQSQKCIGPLHDFLQLAISESTSSDSSQSDRWDLSAEDKYLLKLSLIRSKLTRREVPPVELVVDCLKSEFVTIEQYAELVSVLSSKLSSSPSTGLLRQVCILFSMLLIRNNEPELAALPLVYLGAVPNSKDLMNSSDLILQNGVTFVASVQGNLSSSRLLAQKILSRRRRLLCLIEHVRGRMLFVFIGPKGVIIRDWSTNGLSNEKLNDLLRRTHGLFTVAPTSKMHYHGEDEDLKFYDSFIKYRFREELVEDSGRLSDEALSKVFLEISDLIAEPIAAAEEALCQMPRTGFIDFPTESKMVFLPIDTSQIYAIENGFASRQPISMDIRKHHMPFIPTSREKLDVNILIIGDPSGSLEFSDLEIELVSSNFSKDRVFRLGMDDAIVYSRRKRLMPDVGIVHFVGHHSIAYKDSVSSIIPGASRDVTESEFIGVFSYFRAQLNYLSACSTDSTFFTDPSAQKMSLSKRILHRYPCNVVSTLWPIPDEPAAHFASCFYKNLVEYHGSPEMALWVSKRAFAKGEVQSLSRQGAEGSRLGGPTTRKASSASSSWGAYTLN